MQEISAGRESHPSRPPTLILTQGETEVWRGKVTWELAYGPGRTCPWGS